MGDPRKAKNTYSRPSHPWQGRRIEEEKKIVNSYGLKNKKEVWRVVSSLKKTKEQAKKLIAAIGSQAEKERKQLIEKLAKFNIVNKEAKVLDVLDLSTESLFERRLQTQVVRKGLARTAKQARQFITHRHITVHDRIVTIPSYLVTAEEENQLRFSDSSSLKNEEHPERNIKKEKSASIETETSNMEKESDIKEEGLKISEESLVEIKAVDSEQKNIKKKED